MPFQGRQAAKQPTAAQQASDIKAVAVLRIRTTPPALAKVCVADMELRISTVSGPKRPIRDRLKATPKAHMRTVIWAARCGSGGILTCEKRRTKMTLRIATPVEINIQTLARRR